jgi:hypothetical protein
VAIKKIAPVSQFGPQEEHLQAKIQYNIGVADPSTEVDDGRA